MLAEYHIDSILDTGEARSSCQAIRDEPPFSSMGDCLLSLIDSWHEDPHAPLRGELSYVSHSCYQHQRHDCIERSSRREHYFRGYRTIDHPRTVSMRLHYRFGRIH